jgi:hypothetical protein
LGIGQWAMGNGIKDARFLALLISSMKMIVRDVKTLVETLGYRVSTSGFILGLSNARFLMRVLF